jgi:hypothetical protein
MTAKQYFEYAYLSPLILPFLVLLFEILIGSLTGWDFGELTGLLLGSVIFRRDSLSDLFSGLLSMDKG